MFKLFKKKNNNIDDKGIKVVYENGIVREEVISWINSLGKINVSDLLVSLGFKVTDTIYLYQEYSGLYRVLYSVNEDKIIHNNVIRFNHKNRELIVSSGNESRCYRVVSKDNKKIDMELAYYKRRVSDKISCYHKVGDNSSLFIIDNGDYELTLEFYLDFGTGGYILSEMIDESELENYLVNLEFPIVIDEVYKNICDILKLDESVFEMFNLVVTKNVDKKKPDMVIDEILIQKGELERITKTSDNRSITLDKDGNWSYNKLDNESVFTVRYQEDSECKYRYVYRDNSEKGNGYFSEEDISSVRDCAMVEVDNVKRLVKEIF